MPSPFVLPNSQYCFRQSLTNRKNAPQALKTCGAMRYDDFVGLLVLGNLVGDGHLLVELLQFLACLGNLGIELANNLVRSL